MAALLTSVREGCLTCRGAVIAAYVRYSSTRTSVTRTKRSIYVRTYPTIVVLPDGATINIRYKEPRGIIKVCESLISQGKFTNLLV